MSVTALPMSGTARPPPDVGDEPVDLPCTTLATVSVETEVWPRSAVSAKAGDATAPKRAITKIGPTNSRFPIPAIARAQLFRFPYRSIRALKDPYPPLGAQNATLRCLV